MELSTVLLLVFSCFTLVTCRQPATLHNNTGVTSCTGDELRCDTTRCVPEFARCDGIPDCVDGTDERNCKLATGSRDLGCEADPNDGVGPVCGSDGVTYNNQTALRCANNTKGVSIQVVYRGKCEDPCWHAISPLAAQSKEEDRVCGSDLTIYPSATVLACVNLHSSKANISEVSMDKCESKKVDPCLLLAYVAPRKICGSDNVTYNNVWHMVCTANMYKLDHLKLQHEAECDIECPYSPVYHPVCSTIDYMYANIEALKCRQILSPYIKNEFQHVGACTRHLKQNPCYVDSAYNPVCASNGRTYSSPQHVRCLKNGNTGLGVLHSGPCSVTEVKTVLANNTSEACHIAAHHYEWNPVCASDNVTYGNPFIFICNALNKTAGELQVIHNGECGSFDYCRLEEDAAGDEVCGNDGVTYPKLHALYCAQTTKRHLQLSHSGPCKAADDPCLFRGLPFLDNKGNPMCASNGITYVSPQAAWCHSKSDTEVKVRHDGECF